MGQAEEAPCGDTLREREGDVDIALGVGGQSGIVEGCLVEVLTQLGTDAAFAHAGIASLSGLVGIADDDFLIVGSLTGAEGGNLINGSQTIHGGEGLDLGLLIHPSATYEHYIVADRRSPAEEVAVEMGEV